jgi:hypothetical protein
MTAGWLEKRRDGVKILPPLGIMTRQKRRIR